MKKSIPPWSIWFGALATFLVLVAISLLILPALQTVSSGRPSLARINFKQLGVATTAFDETEQQFAPRFVGDQESRPLLSWRCVILPYLNHEKLHREIDFTQAWDSPVNLPVTQQELPIYWKEKHEGNQTRIMAASGERCAYRPDGVPRTADEFVDGMSQSVMYVSIPKVSAVAWSRPADWQFDLEHPKRGWFHEEEWQMVGFGDGTVDYIQSNIDPEVLRALLTIDAADTDSGKFFGN